MIQFTFKSHLFIIVKEDGGRGVSNFLYVMGLVAVCKRTSVGDDKE